MKLKINPKFKIKKGKVKNMKNQEIKNVNEEVKGELTLFSGIK